MIGKPMARRFASWLVAVGLIATVPAGPAQATLVRDFSLASMTVASQSIVRGTVIDQETLYDARWGRVYTHSIIEVTSTSWGVDRPGDVIVLRQIGGELDGVTSTVVGTAHLGIGDDVVVYARSDGNLHYLVGMAQGLYQVLNGDSGEPVVARGIHGMDGLGFLPTVGPTRRRAPNRTSLATLLERTDAILRTEGRLP